jgi:hypothetical protein
LPILTARLNKRALNGQPCATAHLTSFSDFKKLSIQNGIVSAAFPPTARTPARQSDATAATALLSLGSKRATMSRMMSNGRLAILPLFEY